MSQYPLIRKPYSRTRSIKDLSGQTKQVDDSFGNDTDVNKIVARFARTGIMPQATQEPQYGDVTALQGDLTEIIANGEKAKAELENLQKQQIEENKQKIKENAEKLQKYEEAEANQQLAPKEQE